MFALALTVGIDTYFWSIQYDIRYRKDPTKIFMMWPELHSFYFSVVLNKSQEWGTSPWHWYFTVALPKGVTCAIPLTLVALFYQTRGSRFIDRTALEIIGSSLIFISIFSILPHKELRFIMPVFTLFNVVGAYGLNKM